MKIPKTLKIGGHIYKVILRDRMKNDGADELGTANIFTHQKIWINKCQQNSQIESTLFHEIIEVINALHKLNLSETVICSLETGLYQVLSDNRLLR